MDQAKDSVDREFKDIMICAYADDAAITGPSKQILAFAKRLARRLEQDAVPRLFMTNWMRLGKRFSKHRSD